MKSEELIRRGRPRVCTARKITGFEKQEIIVRLFAGEGVQDDFRIVEQIALPSAEASFDVCTDGKDLFVSVLFWEAGGVPASEGVGNNSVEIVFCPYDDRTGFLQFGAGPGRASWFNHHWPYRDGRPNLAARPQWEPDYHLEDMGEAGARVVFFRFPLSAIVGEGYSGPLGFNVMRTELRTAESATWSHAGGNGFPDGSSCGWLRLSEKTPMPPAEPLCAAPAVPGLQLQTTYDFPDEMCGGPYTPGTMRRELRFLKEHGLGRIYWIDYPGMVDAARRRSPGHHLGHSDFYARTLEAFGGDPMPVTCRLAHEEGLEFFTTIKPYDLWAGDAFVEAHPEYAFRRNPAWTTEFRGQSVAEIVLYADNAKALSFAAAGIRVHASEDNLSFAPVEGARVEEGVVTRPRYRWSPAGKQEIAGSEEVRRIRISGLARCCRYWAIEFPAAESAGSFGNQDYLLAEVKSDTGELPAACALGSPGRDFRTAGLDFVRGAMSAGWSDSSEGTELRRTLPAGSMLGFKAGHDLYCHGMLEPGFAEVRQYWLKDYMQRAIDAGADGVDVRIAHHHVCSEWLAFAYAEPVLEVFRRRFKREPEPKAEDYEAIRRIRGEFHTQFLREAKTLLAAAGRKLEAHVEARMKAPPAYDTFTQIHWDYAAWIEEGILDGVNLKYLGPFNPFVHREIMPRARKRGIPVHVIDAIGDPRSQPRTPEWAVEKLNMVRAGGLNGLNLYEIWVYLRTTPRGEWFRRGCARAVFSILRHARDTRNGASNHPP